MLYFLLNEATGRAIEITPQLCYYLAALYDGLACVVRFDV